MTSGRPWEFVDRSRDSLRTVENNEKGRVVHWLEKKLTIGDIGGWDEFKPNLDTAKFCQDQERLHLLPDKDGVLKCYLPNSRRSPYLPARQRCVYRKDCKDVFTEKMCLQKRLCHPSWGSKFNNNESTWKLLGSDIKTNVMRVIKRCHGCKSFQAVPYTSPVTGNLPRDRTKRRLPFQVIGIDCAGPIKYPKRKNVGGKAWIVVYACAFTRALHLESLKTMDTQEVLITFKRLIARKGWPRKVYSDNGKTFVAGA